MNKRSIVIPDVHQNLGWMKEIDKIENFDSFDEVICLGDFFDSYLEYDGVNIFTVRDVCDYLIELKNRLREKLILILANHDLAYMEYSLKAKYNYSYSGPCYLSCSGFTGKKADDIHKSFYLYRYRGGQEIFWKNFKLYHISNGILYTHAGLSKRWLGAYYGNETVEDIVKKYIPENAIEAVTERHQILSAISKKRGGFDPVGGIVWCDLEEFEPIEYIPQVFGHTAGDNRVVKIGNSMCIDGGQSVYIITNPIEYGVESLILTTKNREIHLDRRG